MKSAFVTWLLLVLTTVPAYAETKKARSTRVPKKSSTKWYNPNSGTLTSPYAVKPIDPIPASQLTTTPTDTLAKRIVNIRLHPIHLATMAFSKDTEFAGRLDLDFLLGERIAIGPSVIYDLSTSWDDASVTAGTSKSKTESRLEVGLLTSVYVIGKTNEGGLILRPHLYYVAPEGQYSDDTGLKDSVGTTAGVRGGAEVAYQVMLPIGLNFEIGGGFTYYYQPYQIDYGTTLAKSEPSSLMPTVTLGVGWAF